MATTKYITGTSEGVLTLTARAVDPDGNVVSTNVGITVASNPVQSAQTISAPSRCYSQILLVSNPQSTLEAACAQFGTQLQYYIGDPRNTVYSTKDCSTIAQDAYYKLDDGSWILVSGGIIIQRGSCATVGVTTNTTSTTITTIPEFTKPVSTNIPPTATAIPTAFTPLTTFVPEVTFTPLAPTLIPPPTTVTEIQPIIIEQPVLVPAPTTTTTTTLTPPPQSEPILIPAEKPAPQPVFGCTDINAINYNPNATNDDGTCQYQNQTVSGGFNFDVTNFDVI
jgi:hypothetical protein